MPEAMSFQTRKTMSVISPGIPAVLPITGQSYTGFSRFMFKTKTPGAKFFFQVLDRPLQPGEGPVSWDDPNLVLMTDYGQEEKNVDYGYQYHVGPIVDQSLILYLWSDRKCSVAVFFETSSV